MILRKALDKFLVDAAQVMQMLYYYNLFYFINIFLFLLFIHFYLYINEKYY